MEVAVSKIRLKQTSFTVNEMHRKPDIIIPGGLSELQLPQEVQGD